MKRIPLKDTERYTIERFRQCKKTERHLAWLKSRKAGVGGSDMSDSRPERFQNALRIVA